MNGLTRLFLVAENARIAIPNRRRTVRDLRSVLPSPSGKHRPSNRCGVLSRARYDSGMSLSPLRGSRLVSH